MSAKERKDCEAAAKTLHSYGLMSPKRYEQIVKVLAKNSFRR